MTREKPVTWKKRCYASDETGKTDFYGGLAVAAVYLNEEVLQALEKAGYSNIKDKAKPEWIKENVPKIIEILGNNYECLPISPEEYNEKYSKCQNMNIVLSLLHNEVHFMLQNKLKIDDFRIIDGFVSKQKFQEHLLSEGIEPIKVNEMPNGADKNYLACALASLIARHAYLKQIEEMSEKWQTKFPIHYDFKGKKSIIPAYKKLQGIIPIEWFCKANFDSILIHLERILEKNRFWENCKECGFYLERKSAKNMKSKFIGCSNFPNCRYVIPEKEKILNKKCKKCDSFLILKYRKSDGVAFFGCSSFWNCRSRRSSRNFWFPVCINKQ